MYKFLTLQEYTMKYLALAALLLSFSAVAQKEPANVPSTSYEDRFGGGNDEFEFETFDNRSVMVAIKRDMEIACDKAGLCTLSAVTSNDARFTTQFNIGVGNQYGGWNNGGGSGTTVIVPNGTDNNNSNNDPYYGLSLRYTRGRCTQRVLVPRALYISMNRYMYGLMAEDGGTRRGFTPADEAMIMFYSTIMKQASGCTAAQ
jgi:hypothetical protein